MKNLKKFNQFINENIDPIQKTSSSADLKIKEIIDRFKTGELDQELAIKQIKEFPIADRIANSSEITNAFTNKTLSVSKTEVDETSPKIKSILSSYESGEITRDQAINTLKSKFSQSELIRASDIISDTFSRKNNIYEAKQKSRKEVLKDADEKYPNLKKGSMKKGLSKMKGKDFKEKAKKNFGWADKPEAAAAAYMRKATGKEPRDL
jgi:hypothetical protein